MENDELYYSSGTYETSWETVKNKCFEGAAADMSGPVMKGMSHILTG